MHDSRVRQNWSIVHTVYLLGYKLSIVYLYNLLSIVFRTFGEKTENLKNPPKTKKNWYFIKIEPYLYGIVANESGIAANVSVFL